jgi:hypothetical protein
MAGTALEAPFAPEEFKDIYREELEAIIAKKALNCRLRLRQRDSPPQHSL